MPVSIAELGNSLRCPKDGCDIFGKILKLVNVNDNVTLEMVCDTHQKKYKQKYSINQFVRMAESALIDDEWIIDFQKKALIQLGRFIQIKNGMEGTFVVKNEKIIKNIGKELICKCGSFYHVTFIKIKAHTKNLDKNKTLLNLYCGDCSPKGKKEWFKTSDVFQLSEAGLIEPTVIQKVKDEYSSEDDFFDVNNAYGGMGTQMAGWVKEDLGINDEGVNRKCFICGTPVSNTQDRCPKCGSDL
ncbi:MAG: hypothetical protein GY870_02220 [archaeon]|nr:hypothetical protein [archaeon]